MRKSGTVQGTLSKLFGKKSANNKSLYAESPPWVLPQGAPAADYRDELHGSFAFLDDSGTATLKSRPGPRVRPMLNFSTSNTDIQGIAVPTPSVPLGFTDNVSLGNGSKMNGNYKMSSSVGDLRFLDYDYLDIPAPPFMPPPPPPTMEFTPENSPPSSSISSPSSPSPPDFIPPIPNSSAPLPPRFLPSGPFLPTAEQHQINVAKWKSELVLNAASKDLAMTLPNRLSLSPAAFQHTQGQDNFDGEPRSTLPKSFKIPPPAPTRTSSMQEPQDITYSKDPPQSPLPSSFNPSFQARLYTSNPGQQSLSDAVNKRKSVLIMEDLPDFLENSVQRSEKSVAMTEFPGSIAVSSLKDSTNVVQNPPVELNKQIKNENAINDSKMDSALIFGENRPKQPYRLNNTHSELTPVVSAKGEAVPKSSQNGTERNTLNNKHGYTQEIHKTSKPTIKIISLKPIIGELSGSNSHASKHDYPSRNEKDVSSKELTRINNEVKPKPENSLENVKEYPPAPALEAPPPPPPPPPPIAVTQNGRSITPLPLPTQNSAPPKTSPIINSTAPPPAPPPLDPATVRMPSPLLSPKPKTTSIPSKPHLLVPPPPPAPPPLPSSDGLSSSVPLLEALQAKQQTLRKIPKSLETGTAQRSSISSIDDDQKIRVGKIKGELEALFSPKKDERVEKLKKVRPPDPEGNKNSDGSFSNSKGDENKLVNSLMLKVPLLPPNYEKEDADADNSEWVPKSSNTDIPIPEPDYLPASPIHKTEKPTYSEVQKKIPKASLEIPVSTPPLVSTHNTNPAYDINSSIPIYKPHRETIASRESSTLDELPVVTSKPEAHVGITLYGIPQHTESATSGPSRKEEPLTSQVESTIAHCASGEQVVENSPMALLMAAQKRAQKAKSVERANLPKISVANGIITSSSASPYDERRANTFVVPNKENVGQLTEEVTSFTSTSPNVSDCLSPSGYRNAGLQSSDRSSTVGRNFEYSTDQSRVPNVYHSADVLAFPKDGHEDYVESKWRTFDDRISTTLPNSVGSPTFNISAFPSPLSDSKRSYEHDYGIIPPPVEFMNSPVAPSSNLMSLQQRDRSYHFVNGANLQSDFIANYDRSNSVTQPFVSLSTTSNSGFNNYLGDSYSSAPKDLQRASLIKKRLYLPEPESSRNYGSNTSSLRSSTMPMSCSNVHAQSGSTIIADARRSSTTSRFLPQGRRVSTENIGRTVPSGTELKYRYENADFSMGPSSRSQGKYQQGMTFTVRPGTRQPISQMYQGGYL